MLKIGIVWDLSDTFNGLMAVPNLIALISLSSIIFATARKGRADLEDSLPGNMTPEMSS